MKKLVLIAALCSAPMFAQADSRMPAELSNDLVLVTNNSALTAYLDTHFVDGKNANLDSDANQEHCTVTAKYQAGESKVVSKDKKIWIRANEEKVTPWVEITDSPYPYEHLVGSVQCFTKDALIFPSDQKFVPLLERHLGLKRK